MNNSHVFNFAKESSFLFDLREKKYESLLENINDLNNLKPDENDILFLDELINEKKILNQKMENRMKVKFYQNLKRVEYTFQEKF